ncbi:hypothetical protein AeMF1_008981 [Aphanomyces euteiches]|nr:hypothetical protein AeMF1_008981 [Aphanomyces euteiches]KAH9187376.1 hypothetical protein AeNC1_010649 [Aphanomyces euteiches]
MHPKLATLPVDVLLKIVFAIPDAQDMFAVIEALSLKYKVGPLYHLYRLSLSSRHRINLHPKLWLKPSILGSSQDKFSYESIAKLYDKVIVEANWHDLHWLKLYLNPTAKIDWKIKDFPFMTEISEDWFDLQITQLFVSSKQTTPLSCCWNDLLPKLQHLTSLIVLSDANDVGNLFELVAKSDRITELEIVAGRLILNASNFIQLTKWFRERSVHKFSGSFSRITSDIELKQTFCQAMFSCPTLERLELYHFDFDDVDFTQLIIAVKSL